MSIMTLRLSGSIRISLLSLGLSGKNAFVFVLSAEELSELQFLP
jgi:hypothetical protein